VLIEENFIAGTGITSSLHIQVLVLFAQRLVQRIPRSSSVSADNLEWEKGASESRASLSVILITCRRKMKLAVVYIIFLTPTLYICRRIQALRYFRCYYIR
jgi:hypothetical protein